MMLGGNREERLKMIGKLRSKLFWNDVGLSGLIVGGILAVAAASAYFLRDNAAAGVVNNIILILAFIVVPYFLGKRFSLQNANWGLTFMQGLRYMIVMYALAGFIYGFSLFLILNFDVEYYMMLSAEFTKLLAIEGTEISRDVVKEVLVLSSVFSLSFYTLLPSLIIGALIKREPAVICD